MHHTWSEHQRPTDVAAAKKSFPAHSALPDVLHARCCRQQAATRQTLPQVEAEYDYANRCTEDTPQYRIPACTK